MKEIVLRVKNQNWGMIGPNDLEEREWTIYSDLTVEYRETYNTYKDEEKYKISNIVIEQAFYEKILKYIEMSKDNNTKIDACDGDAWEFVQLNNNSEIWKRELDYIYGIQSLEEIARILFSLVK